MPKKSTNTGGRGGARPGVGRQKKVLSKKLMLEIPEVVSAISAKESQSERLGDFIRNLKGQDGIIREFDSSL